MMDMKSRHNVDWVCQCLHSRDQHAGTCILGGCRTPLPEVKIPTESRSGPVRVGKLQGRWGELVLEGATADPGSEFPYELVKRALSDISMSTRGTELLWV